MNSIPVNSLFRPQIILVLIHPFELMQSLNYPINFKNPDSAWITLQLVSGNKTLFFFLKNIEICPVEIVFEIIVHLCLYVMLQRHG